MSLTLKDLAKMIDHSLLHPTMSDEILERECLVALKYDTASVCIKPCAVSLAKRILKGSDVKVGTVAGFPHGNSRPDIKAAEAKQACRDGAVEIDMVINIGKAIGGAWEYVKDEIALINARVQDGGAILKVIFENDYLEDETIRELCRICSDLNVAYVKTSTGYGFVKQENGMYSYSGATVPHLKLMRASCAGHVKVKAAGGVRTLEDLLLVRSLGVSRVGATATAAILDEAAGRLERGEDLDRLRKV